MQRLIQVFTNGILMDRFQDILIHPKVYLLINCNAPTDTGDAPFRKMCENLSALMRHGITPTFACNTVYSQNCVVCQKVMKCMGGCLAYKLGPIPKPASIAEEKIRV